MRLAQLSPGVAFLGGAHLAARFARVAAGLVLVLHGLAQSVLPMRGAGLIEESLAARALASAAWIVAMVGLVSAGLGVLGVRALRRAWRPLALGGAASSALGIALLFRRDLAAGLALDALSAGLAFALPAAIPARAHRLRDGAGFALLAYVALAAVSHPLHRHWGARPDELAMSLPGDFAGRHPAYEVNHAVTVRAPPEAIWPWLVQMGQDRGGFYSYDGLENAFGLRIHNADRIHPEWQSRQLGDLVRAAPAGYLGVQADLGWRVHVLEPNRAFGMKGWGTFVLLPQPDGTTRLLARTKMGDPKFPAWGAVMSFMMLDFPHFVMERRQLLGIAERAEAHAGGTGLAPPGT